MMVEYVILNALIKGQTIASLEKAGVPYVEISNAVAGLNKNGYLKMNNQMAYEVTDKGRTYFELLHEEYLTSGNWTIAPYAKFRTKKIDKFDIYIQ